MRREIIKITFYGGIFVFFLYWTVTNNTIFLMRHISLGQPDPGIFGMWGIVMTAVFLWQLRLRWTVASNVIATSAGAIHVHNLKPMAVMDPLDYCDFKIPDGSDITLSDLELITENDENTAEWIKEIVKENGWDMGTIKKIRDEAVLYKQTHLLYNSAVNPYEPVGIWCDAGIRLLGMHGLRFGGRDILIGNPDMIKKFGNDAVCVAQCECFHGADQLANLPPYVIAILYDVLSKFVPGRHTIVYFTEPHPQAVRAFNERTGYYEYTLGSDITPIDSKARELWLGHLVTKADSEVHEKRDELTYLESLDKKDEVPSVKPETDEGGEDD